MKNAILLLFFVTLGSNAMASSKVCFGSTKGDDTKGVVIHAEISQDEVTIKAVKGEVTEGTFPTYGTTVEGRDGKTYLKYKGSNDSDYQDVIMIDEALLDDSTSGLLQIRARGEGFFNRVFVCKDARK